MNFVPLTAAHCMGLGPLASIHTGMDITPEMAERLEELGGVAAVEGDTVIGIGGLMERWEGVAQAWVWLTRDWKRYARAITHEVARNLIKADYPRIEAAVLHEYKQGHAWMQRLGFEVETPCARKWGADGRDYTIYVRIT